MMTIDERRMALQLVEDSDLELPAEAFDDIPREYLALRDWMQMTEDARRQTVARVARARGCEWSYPRRMTRVEIQAHYRLMLRERKEEV